MHWAVYNNDLEAAELLIGAGADVKTKSREGATPLYLASIRGNPAMIERLIEAGADPNEQGPQGEDPAHVDLAKRKRSRPMKVLLDHKADVNAERETCAAPLR
jgi:ankyrin repeat protein